MNPTLRTIATSLVVLAFWLSGAGIAGAHTALTSSDPAKGETMAVPPTVIVLTFTEDINPAFANVVLNDAEGRNWIPDSPRVDGPRLTAAVGPDRPANGAYTVGYRVVSADGHPVSGTYGFSIDGVPNGVPPASAPADAAPSTVAVPPQPSATAGSDTGTSIITAAVAGLALGGAVAFWQSRRHRRKNGVDEAGSDSTRSGGEGEPGER